MGGILYGASMRIQSNRVVYAPRPKLVELNSTKISSADPTSCAADGFRSSLSKTKIGI